MSSAPPRAGGPPIASRGGSTWLPAAAAAALLVAVAPLPAPAQTIKPWVPPASDSLVQWASEAKVRFRANLGDSIGGDNYRAYDLVGRMGRRLLRSLGREGMRQAAAIEPVLDTLGLDTDIRVDPDLPYFALLMVRNPTHRETKAVGFLFWYLENDLRMQGVQFQRGIDPQMRVWWTGAQEAPYSWGVMDRTRGVDPLLRFTLLRLEATGRFWNLVQFDDTGIKMGSAGTSTWADVNGDNRYEAVAWIPAEPESLFDECSSCPKRINELVFMERPEGFRLLDTRLVPTPYSTFTAFIRLLLEGNRSQAARLVKDPALVQRAIAAGWAARKEWRTWLVEEAEPGAAWPLWLLIRHKGPQGEKRYRVDFEMSRGRWVIRNWTERRVAPTPPRPQGSGGASGSVRTPGVRPPARADSVARP